MPYAFAHPAAVIPVAMLLGRRAVPSALAIGSMAPDAWYLVPLVGRDAAHGALGALWFCLPLALLGYVAFHLVFKQPLLALLPEGVSRRAALWSAPGLPRYAWPWVLLSLAAGIATHLAWDAFTHAGHVRFVEQAVSDGVPLYRVLQHASTVVGTALLAWWLARKLRAAPPAREVPGIEPRLRKAAFALLLAVPAVVFVCAAESMDLAALRTAVRAGAVAALWTLGLLLLYFQLSPRLRARPRRCARACATARPR